MMGEHVRLRVLGRGAFGLAALYRRADGGLVVVKECDIGGLRQDARDKAVVESETLALLKHPNIVTYFDAFEDDSKFFIEMEYADGGNLRQLVEARNGDLIPQQEVLFLSWQLLRGLAHVHNCGILHRDIKSENIFMTSHGVLKLGDFGISKVLSDSVHAATMVGTPYYMPPEMFKGERYDSRCDVFSAGCVVHELCTLHRTFQATNMGAIMHRVMRRQYDDICTKTYTPALQRAIHMMLETEAAARPTAEQLLASELWNTNSTLFTSKLNRMLSLCDMAAARTPSSSSLGSGVFVAKATSLYMWGGGLSQKLIGTFSSSNAALQLAIGSAHCAVCTSELRVYTWSVGGAMSDVDGFSCGQLGHGAPVSQRQPQIVEALERLPCVQVACGEDFTLCRLKSGQLVAFGSNFNGCLGIGDDPETSDPTTFLLPDASVESRFPSMSSSSTRNVSEEAAQSVTVTDSRDVKSADGSQSATIAAPTRDCNDDSGSHGDEDGEHSADSLDGTEDPPPKHIKSPFDDSGNALAPVLVPFFSKTRIKQIACGDEHVMALTEERQLYTWGVGEYGKLGLGDEDDVCVPTRVPLRAVTAPEFVVCGADASAFVSQSGQLFVTGNNEYNKLCLNFNESVLSQRRRSSLAEKGAERGHIRSCFSFTLVRWEALRSGLHRVALGQNHMAALTKVGSVITCGCNSNGQLGTGDTRPRTGPVVVKRDLVGVEVVSVACGDSFTLAATKGGRLFGWGQAASHRLSSLVADTPAPRLVPDISGVVEVVCRGPMTLCRTEEVKSSRRMAQLSSSRDDPRTDGSTRRTPGMETAAGSVFETGDDSAAAELLRSSSIAQPAPLLPVDSADTFASASELLTETQVTPNTDTNMMDSAALEYFQGMQNLDAHSNDGGGDADDLNRGTGDDQGDGDEEGEELPPWLQAELAGEVIPMPKGFEQQCGSMIQTHSHDLDAAEAQQTDEPLPTQEEKGVSSSTLDLDALSEQELRELARSQAATIHRLHARVEDLTAIVRAVKLATSNFVEQDEEK